MYDDLDSITLGVSPSLDAFESVMDVFFGAAAAAVAAPSVSDSYPKAVLSVGFVIDETNGRGGTAEATIVDLVEVVLSLVDLVSRLGLFDEPLDCGLGEIDLSFFRALTPDGDFLLLLLSLVLVTLGDSSSGTVGLGEDSCSMGLSDLGDFKGESIAPDRRGTKRTSSEACLSSRCVIALGQKGFGGTCFFLGSTDESEEEDDDEDEDDDALLSESESESDDDDDDDELPDEEEEEEDDEDDEDDELDESLSSSSEEEDTTGFFFFPPAFLAFTDVSFCSS